MSAGKRETWEWIKALVIALLLAGLIRYFLFAPIVVDGESMQPTLHNHDRLIINKVAYEIGEPERFDIVVFHATEKKDFIKRVIGLPGEHIEYHDDVLYVDGEPVPEPFLKPYKKKVQGNYTYDFTLEETAVGQKTVPEGELFVMGDNRRRSKDSRIIGTIPIEEVVGEAAVQFWPLEDFRFME
ncbi:MAG TPA: signal peptidase I [Bacillales bacterium]|nr:signal peptidase I [Bacillales bacterium]